MRIPRSLRALAVLVLAGALTGAGATAASADSSYPVLGSLAEGVLASAGDPAAPPPGVNVPGCHLSAQHPRPVVLVTGTFGNMTDDWSGLGPVLANAGYCVYSTPIGGDPNALIQTIGPVATSAQEIATYVNQVLAGTGATQVDMVGHSQGGLIAEYYLKFLGGGSKVHTFVGLSPTTHGTTVVGLATLAALIPGATSVISGVCDACSDQLPHSAIVQAVDNGPIAQPGVNYTIIETLNETAVTPVGSSFINEPGVHNLWVQNYCPLDWTDHADLPYDRTTQRLAENALDPSHPQRVTC